MNGHPGRPANCAACGFWRKLRESEGLCCRRAPEPSIQPEEAAHWPQTRSWQWCGEGVATSWLSSVTRCGDCAFWRRPEGGLNPLDRGDMPMSWWERAGLCCRHAPRPVGEPGPRAFWRATLDTSCCAEGEPRSQAETAEISILRGDSDA